MNQYFNFNRFGLLLRLHGAQNAKNQLLSAGLIIGLTLILMMPMLATKGYSQMAEVLHFLALFLCVMLGGNLFASTAFNQYSNPSTGIAAIMIPASRFEKFLVTFLVSLVFVTLYITLYWALHVWFIELANESLPVDGRKYYPIPSDPRTFFTYCYFLIYGAVFLGSIYFTKNSFVKSVAVLLVISIGAFLLYYGLAYHFTANPSFLFTFPFTVWKISRGKEYVVDFPEPLGDWIWYFLVILVVSFWCIALVRLKEKQI